MNRKLLLSLLLTGTITTANAQNPIVQTRYTADPAPMADGDTLYLYADVDEPNASFFWMYQWRVYSTTDIVNWRDHGELMGLNTFKWADDRAWATQCIKRNGKYYWYICAHNKEENGMSIGVAVADSPVGPFKDALGKPLYSVKGDWSFIDPTVFIDDKDGQAYLAWGNPRLYCLKLNQDMISYSGKLDTLDVVHGKDIYTEGPWMSKRGKNYYMVYAAGGVPEHIAYSMAKKPMGPYNYMGEIMPKEVNKSFTNHSGTVDFKGHSYFFYHTGTLPGGGGFDRSMAVEEFKYNKDGSIPTIMPTEKGVDPVGTLNPYKPVEGETMAFSKGLSTDQNLTDVYVSEVNDSDWIKVREVDFGTTSPASIQISAASATQGGIIEVHIDDLQGTKIAEIAIEQTGAWDNWKEFTAPVQSQVTGKHDVWFLFRGQKGRNLLTLNRWVFKL